MLVENTILPIEYVVKQFHRSQSVRDIRLCGVKIGVGKKSGRKPYKLALKRNHLDCPCCGRKVTSVRASPGGMTLLFFSSDQTTNHNCITIDHIQSKNQGGSSSDSNYQLMCRDCNSTKGSDSYFIHRGVTNITHYVFIEYMFYINWYIETFCNCSIKRKPNIHPTKLFKLYFRKQESLQTRISQCIPNADLTILDQVFAEYVRRRFGKKDLYAPIDK